MRFAYIDVENFLGVRSLRLGLSSVVTLFAGPNAAGKSSLRDAIALALTGDLGRVSLKKDAGQLVREGATSAFCKVVDGDGDVYETTLTAAGKLTARGTTPDTTLPFALEAQRFAHLEPTARRSFLFELMGVKMTPAEIRRRLEDRLFPRGCNGAQSNRLDRVAPLLRAGFDAAAAEAKQRATQAKGAWRAVTGETYGAVKGIDWAAPRHAFDAAGHATATNALRTAETTVGELQQRVGELTQAARGHQAEEQRRGALREKAERLPRARTKLATDEKNLEEQRAEAKRLEAAAGSAPRVGLVHDLYQALEGVLDFLEVGERFPQADAAMAAYVQEFGKPGAAGDAKATEQLARVRDGLALIERSIEADRRDIAVCEAAAKDLKELGPMPAVGNLAAAHAQLTEAQAARAAAAKKVDELAAAKTAAESADRKTKEAADHHADVEAWDAIAQALSPDGIPAELLGEALGPLNARLEQSALDAEWPLAKVDADMTVTGGGRAYRLLSESERWRVDAMLAEAIGHLSGNRLLVLDRFDVLEPGKGRSDLFAWLDILAENGELDSALVFGTLRALPADLPATVTAHWLSNGVVQGEEEKCLAAA